MGFNSLQRKKQKSSVLLAQWAGESARQHIPCVLVPKPLSCSSRQLASLTGQVAVGCEPLVWACASCSKWDTKIRNYKIQRFLHWAAITSHWHFHGVSAIRCFLKQLLLPIWSLTRRWRQIASIPVHRACCGISCQGSNTWSLCSPYYGKQILHYVLVALAACEWFHWLVEFLLGDNCCKWAGVRAVGSPVESWLFCPSFYICVLEVMLVLLYIRVCGRRNKGWFLSKQLEICEWVAMRKFLRAA